MTQSTCSPRILVAGIGNMFLEDDGFGGEVARRLERRPLPAGVCVFDFGTGGLDLAYELMRGYDALILVDASRRGEPPGTLSLIEPDPESVEGGIEDGTVLDPHAMDPESVLRFVKSLAGWPGRVVVIACEPGEIGDLGVGLSPAVEQAVERALDLCEQTIADIRSAGAAREG